MFVFFSHFSSYCWFLVSYHFVRGKKKKKLAWYNFYPFKCFETCFVAKHVIYSGSHSMHIWKEYAFCYFRMDFLLISFILTGLICHLRPLSPYWFSVWMIFYCIIVNFPLMSFNICFIYFVASILGTYMLANGISSSYTDHIVKIMAFFGLLL